MRLILGLALADLWRDRVHLFCNAAVLAGVLVPLLVLFGVRNGVYEALVGRLLANPATLQIDTRGNAALTPADAAEVRAWPDTAFVTLKTRSLFDYANIRRAGSREIREAVLVPSGPGDPMLAPAEGLGPGEVAVSAELASQLGLAPGDGIDIITQAPERPRQLVVPARVAQVVARERGSGRVVHAGIEVLDLIEAFYDGYALPDHGIAAGRPLAGRVVEFEGMRAYATALETLAPLQARIEARFGLATEARTAEVERVLGLGRNLGLALTLTAAVSALGLGAALVFGFWAEVARKRRLLAQLGLMGVGPAGLAAVPVIQAAATALAGLALSAGLFAAAAAVAERLFGGGIGDGGGLVRLHPGQAVAVAGGVMAFVVLASLAAARSAGRTDPASVLREAG